MLKLQTLGADPEVFLLNGDKVVSAIGKIGGTKEEPVKIGETTSVQEDNVLLEFNIIPATDKTMFLSRMKSAIEDVEKIIPPAHTLHNVASAELAPEELGSFQAWLIGCAPTVNAWTRKAQPAGKFDSNVRTSSGHVHIGYGKQQRSINFAIAKACDLFLGVPSVLIDKDRERRKHYGVAGELRHKPYGVEYRTLSSFWIKDPVLCAWVWESIEAALQYLNKYGVSELDAMKDDICGAINNYDVRLCNKLIKYTGKLL